MNTRTLIIICSLTLLLAGCELETIRPRPTEYQRASADATFRLAAANAENGTPPNSPSSIALRDFAGAMQGYAGPPKDVLDIDPLIQQSRGKWEMKERQNRALKLQATWARALVVKVSEQLARTAERYASNVDEDTLPTKDAVRDIVGLQQLIEASVELGNQIEIPGLSQPGEDVRQAILSAQRAAKETAAAAQSLAGRRYTVEDVADVTVQSTNELMDWVQSNSELVTVLGGGTVLSVIGAIRGKQRKAVEIVKDEKIRSAERRADLLTPAPPTV